MRRVVVTGIGVVSACWQHALVIFGAALSEGRSAIGPITKVDTADLRFKNAAEVRGFDPGVDFDDKSLLRLDPFSQFGIAAVREAVADSQIVFTDELRGRTGVVTGSCLGGKETEDNLFLELYGEKKTRFPPTVIPRVMSNAVASQVSMEYGLTGATFTVSTACSSANHAIGHAFWLVRQGTLDTAVTGGSEAPLTLGHLKAWESMRVVSPDTCRPFSKDRSGMILGEGGAMFVIETLDSAVRRGAKIYAEITGFGNPSADAHHLTMPLAEGAAKAMREALRDGGTDPKTVGDINAHGTATQANDVMESAAINLVFGEHTTNIRVSSTKKVYARPRTWGRRALEAAATVLGLHHKILPPTANFNAPDPECNVNVIKNEAVPAEPESALFNSFAFAD